MCAQVVFSIIVIAAVNRFVFTTYRAMMPVMQDAPPVPYIKSSRQVFPPIEAFRRSHIHLDAATREKGSQFLTMLYGPERAANLFTTWGDDFEWLTKDVVYGMFYADESVLDALETELITYMAIACQGLPTTVQNHLGGLLRMGLSVEEVEGVTKCGELVARWAGCSMKSWPDVRAVVAGLK